MTTPLSPAAALDQLAGGLDDTAVGVLSGRPLLALDLDLDGDHGGDHDDHEAAGSGAMVSRLTDLLAGAPVVLVGVSRRADPPAVPEPGLDVYLSAAADPPRPWVGCPDGVEAELDALAAAVDASPAASAALVQLLRVGDGVTAAEAVVAESWVYGLLQAGADHRAWLAARADRPRHDRPGPGVVALRREGPTLVVTLDRPEVRNAYGARMRDELVEALAVARADEGVERIELRGAGPSFCSGGDLDEFGTGTDPVQNHLVRTTRNAGLHLAALAGRTTAHVHGSCVGAGVELPAFVGEVVARPGTTFWLPEIAMGLVPGAGGTASIPRRIGRHRTAHLALAGRPLDVGTALAWGLVDRIDPEPEPHLDPAPARPIPDPAHPEEHRP